MRRVKYSLALVFAAVVMIFISPAAKAENSLQDEIIQKSGADEMYGSLNNETKELLSSLGADSATAQLDGDNVFSVLSKLVRDRLSEPLKALATIVAVAILCKLAACFNSEETDTAVTFAGALACAAVIVTPLLRLITSTTAAVESASVFLLASVPVYAVLMTVGGNVATGTSYSFLALTAGNVIPIISSSVVMPLLRIFLALALVSAVLQLKTDRLANSLYGFAKWLLVFSVTVFSGILSVQTMLNAQVDAAGNKAAKLITASAVPIVGSAFGDAVAAIQNSIHIVKSGVGAFGMLVALCIFAPTAVETALWVAVCSLGQIACDLFDRPKISSFLGMCASAARMLLAVIAAACAVSVVTAAIVLFVKGQA